MIFLKSNTYLHLFFNISVIKYLLRLINLNRLWAQAARRYEKKSVFIFALKICASDGFQGTN